MPINGVHSGDGTRLAIGYPSFLRVFDAATGKELAGTPTDFVRYSHIRPLALNENGTRVAHGLGSWRIQLANVPAAASEKTVRMKPFAELAAHSAGITSLAFSPGGDRLVSGCDHGVVKVWDTRTGPEAIGLKLPQPEPVHRVEFTADGHRVWQSVPAAARRSSTARR